MPSGGIDEVRGLVRRAIELLGSRRIAATLIGTWAGLLVVWILPRTFEAASATAALAAYTGMWYGRALAWGLLINLAACLALELSRYPAAAALPDVVGAEKLKERGAPAFRSSTPLRSLADRLVAAGWTVRLDEEGGMLAAAKGRYAGFGGLLMHAALTLAIVTVVFAPSVFSGRVLLLPGQSFTGRPVEYMGALAGVSPRASRPTVSFKVDLIDAHFWRDTSVADRFSAKVSNLGGAGRGGSMSRSLPLFLDATTWVGVSELTHAVRYTLRGVPGGGLAVTRDVRALSTLSPGRTAAFVVRVGRQEIAYRVLVAVYPDDPRDGRVAATRSYNIVKPKFRVNIQRALTDEEGRDAGTWIVRLGEPIRFQGNTLTLDSLGYGAVFDIVRVPFLPWTALALAIGLGGLTWRLARPRRECYIAEASGRGRAKTLYAAARTDLDPVASSGYTRELAADLGLSPAKGEAAT